jgi:hypothetical protein
MPATMTTAMTDRVSPHAATASVLFDEANELLDATHLHDNDIVAARGLNAAADRLRLAAAMLRNEPPKVGDIALRVNSGEQRVVEKIEADGTVWFQAPAGPPKEWTRACHISQTVKL